jgi:hypothetical protein
LKILLHIEHVEKNLSSRVAVAVVEKEKEELGVKEIYSERIGIRVADAGTDDVEDARTVDVGAFVA